MLYPNEKNVALTELKDSYKKGEIDKESYVIKKSELTYFGYTNKRKFWYAIGKPISMLYFSLMLLYSSFFISENVLKSTLKKISILGVSISFYFIVWAFWYRGDFPIHLYYIAIGAVSIFSTVVSYFVIKSRNSMIQKIRILTNHIVLRGKKHVADENKKGYILDYMKTFKKISE
jgi:hypothetical protein